MATRTKTKTQTKTELINKQVSTLLGENWGNAGVKSYVNFIDQEFSGMSGNLEEIKERFKQLHVIGSRVFTQVWLGSFNSHRFGHKHQNATILLMQLQNILEAEFDENNFLIFKTKKYRFPNSGEELVEYFNFVDELSLLVSSKYSKYELNDKFEHQLRYWLDKPLVDFINANFKRNATVSVLTNFIVWLQMKGIKQLLGNPGASLHNRTASAQSVNPQNQKVTVGHLELIFTSDGNKTISMWNELKTTKAGKLITDPAKYNDQELQNIANTDSANYAHPKSFFGKFRNSGGHRHNLLDANPGNWKKGMEADIRTAAKQKFHATHPYKTDLTNFLPISQN